MTIYTCTKYTIQSRSFHITLYSRWCTIFRTQMHTTTLVYLSLVFAIYTSRALLQHWFTSHLCSLYALLQHWFTSHLCSLYTQVVHYYNTGLPPTCVRYMHYYNTGLPLTCVRYIHKSCITTTLVYVPLTCCITYIHCMVYLSLVLATICRIWFYYELRILNLAGSKLLWCVPCVAPRIPDPVPPSKYSSAFNNSIHSV